MPATTNKQKLIGHLIGKPEKGAEFTGDLPVLEQFIYAICREGVEREEADRAYAVLRERFFDWNEIRVSSHHEIEEALSDLPDADQRALRCISFLQEVFETTFSFDLESLKKKGLKQAIKQLSRYQAANDYIVSWITQKSLGGHAIPLDTPTMRVVHRVGLIDSEIENTDTIRSSLEHLIPKARAATFCDHISAIAAENCFEDDPKCSSCELLHDCPTGQENLHAVGSGRSRTKPR